MAFRSASDFRSKVAPAIVSIVAPFRFIPPVPSTTTPPSTRSVRVFRLTPAEPLFVNVPPAAIRVVPEPCCVPPVHVKLLEMTNTAAPSSVPADCVKFVAFDSLPTVVSVSVRVPKESRRLPALCKLKIEVVPKVLCSTVFPCGMQTCSVGSGSASPLQFAGVCQEVAVPVGPPSNVLVPGSPQMTAAATGGGTDRGPAARKPN